MGVILIPQNHDMTILLRALLISFFYIGAPVAAEHDFVSIVEHSDEIIIKSDFAADSPFNPQLKSANFQPKMLNLPFQNEVNHAAQVTSLSPALLHAVIATESGHRLGAVSTKGAFGPMQLMPKTALSLKVSAQDTAERQIVAGAQYLKSLISRFGGNLSLALAAYNAGPTSVEKYQFRIPPYVETQHYVQSVHRYLNAYTAYQ